MMGRGADMAICLRVAILTLVLGTGGCAHGMTGVEGAAPVSPSPSVPWSPPSRLASNPAPPKPAPAPDIPPELLSDRGPLDPGRPGGHRAPEQHPDPGGLGERPGRRGGLRERAGGLVPLRSTPRETTPGRSRAGSPGGPSSSRSPTARSLSLSWLLFNFGGRRASIEESREALVAADWTHNAVIQNVILDVEQAYFQYVTARALAASEEASVEEAKTSLDAAGARHDAGLATIADVLQAKTALAQAQLALDGIRGQIETTRGALATAMGLPASTRLDVAVEEGPPPLEETGKAVEEYLARAEAARPDLAAARASAAAAAAHRRSVKAEGWPVLSAGGSLGRTYLDSPDYLDTYSGTIQVQLPLFTGFSHHYDVRKAEAQARAAEARRDELQQQVVLEVWTSYYNLKTARQRLATSEDLLAQRHREPRRGRGEVPVGSGEHPRPPRRPVRPGQRPRGPGPGPRRLVPGPGPARPRHRHPRSVRRQPAGLHLTRGGTQTMTASRPSSLPIVRFRGAIALAAGTGPRARPGGVREGRCRPPNAAAAPRWRSPPGPRRPETSPSTFARWARSRRGTPWR